MNARRVAAVSATVGAGIWLAQTLVLVIRGGEALDGLEGFTFPAGLIAFMARPASQPGPRRRPEAR